MSEEDAYADQAKKLVDDVIESAILRLETGMALTEREKTFESIKQQSGRNSPEITFIKEENFVVENIKWLTIGEYSVEKAEEKMHEYIKVFFFFFNLVSSINWMQCI